MHLTTERLVLRPFTLADAPRVQTLAGDAQVAATTVSIPHPYPDGAAEKWIALHEGWAKEGRAYVFAITLKSTQELIGCIDFCSVSQAHKRAELGYWIGVPYWGQGYATEAAKALAAFGFETLGLNKITSRHIDNNPASGKVMQKIGMKKEGTLREEMLRRDGRFRDLEVYGLLRSEC